MAPKYVKASKQKSLEDTVGMPVVKKSKIQEGLPASKSTLNQWTVGMRNALKYKASDQCKKASITLYLSMVLMHAHAHVEEVYTS